jgi:hypothetical protein
MTAYAPLESPTTSSIRAVVLSIWPPYLHQPIPCSRWWSRFEEHNASINFKSHRPEHQTPAFLLEYVISTIMNESNPPCRRFWRDWYQARRRP